MPAVLSVGTTDPRNVAGVGRDLIVGTELGCAVLTAISAVSVQDDRGVRSLHLVPVDVLRAQLDVLDAGVMRVGALCSEQSVGAIVERLTRRPVHAVVDPVTRASGGGAVLADDATFAAIRERLAVLPTVVLTPNLSEAAALLGRAKVDDPVEAAVRLRERGARAVLVKGGHAPGDPADVLATAGGVETFVASRIESAMGGTGCTLAMALACGMARNLPLRDAVVMARAYLRAKMMQSAQRTGGMET